jgi:copper chaperone
MTCAHCVHAVTSELESVPGVTRVAVDLVPGGASVVTVTSDARLSAEAVLTALDEAGDYRLAGPGDDSADSPLTAPGRTLPVL